jgi:hypothetical protein
VVTITAFLQQSVFRLMDLQVEAVMVLRVLPPAGMAEAVQAVALVALV